MKKIILSILAVFIIAGCATAPRRKSSSAHVTTDTAVVELSAFCKQNRLRYSFDTLDDIIRITSSNIDMKVLLASSLVYYNGNVLTLDRPAYYRDGKIFVPAQLKKIIATRPSKRFSCAPPSASIKTIVIDAGHGGKDPGAISKRGLREKGINLKVAIYLKDELQRQGFKVYLTRSKDVYLTLKQRVEIARLRDADLFISIHSNANRSTKIKGMEVYYLAEKHFGTQSKRIAMAENAALGSNKNITSKGTKQIVWDLVCAENNICSVEFANTLTSTMKRMGFKVRSPRGAPFYVLKYAYVPSVLVEIGYLTNPSEEKLIRKTHYQKQVAQGIALGVSRLNKSYAKSSRAY